MGRNRTNLVPYTDYLLQAHSNQESREEMLHGLEHTFGVKTSRTVLNRFLKTIVTTPQRGPKTISSSELCDQITTITFERPVSDAELFTILKERGFTVSKTGVAHLRRSLRILKKYSPELLQEKLNEARAFLRGARDADEAHFIRRLSKRELQYHFSKFFKLHLPREPLFACFKEFFPEAVQEKLELLHRRRGGWTVPGPNYMWCIDAHLKLRRFGIEVYAGIDAYSRYVPWFYTGVSATTARSVFAQWIEVVGKHGFIPMQMRGDCGNEVNMVAGGLYFLALGSKTQRILKPRRLGPDLVVVFEEGAAEGDLPIRHDVFQKDQVLPVYGPDRPLEMQDVFLRGKSTDNQRIESWWKQLRDSRALFWTDYFHKLESTDAWTETRIEDHIALLFTFMPRIRTEFAEWVEYWNEHTIRLQRNRRHVVSGKPITLFYDYNEAEALDCRCQMDWNRYAQLKEIARKDNFELDRYLPQQMMDLCASLMIDFVPHARNAPDQPFRQEYDHLRKKLRAHMLEGNVPELCIMASPKGAFEEVKELVRVAGGDVDRMMEVLEHGLDGIEDGDEYWRE